MINPAQTSLSIGPARVVTTLFVIMLLLILLGFGASLCRPLTDHVRLLELIDHFDLDRERNFPTYFSILLLCSCSFLLGLIASHVNANRGNDLLYWVVLSAGFLFMGFDEAFSLHERLGKPVKKLLGEGELGFFYFAWVIPAIVVVSSLGLFFLGFLRRLQPYYRWRFLLAGGLYLSGCIGVELFAGRHVEAHGMHLTYKFLVVAEEGLEMTGLIAFLGLLLVFIKQHIPDGIRII